MVTQGEKDAYVAHVQAALKREREQRETRCDEVTRTLAAGGLSTEKRESLTAEIDTLNRAIADLGETAGHAAGNPDEITAARDDFEIVNKKLEAAFWRYYRTDSIHSFYPPGSKEEAQVFQTPPWRSK